MIKIIDMYKVYKMGDNEVRALDGVSIDISQNEFVSIVGPSGSGKSTLMNMIGCLDTPTSGEYFIDGTEVSKMRDDQLADIRNRKIGFIFQSYNLLGKLTVLENVELPLIYMGKPKAQRHEIARTVLERVGLSGREHHKPNQLSGGQQQRVAIARAIVTKPAILFADEPTGNLDTARSREIMELLSGLNGEQGVTIVVVTHEPEMAAYAKRIVNFRDGLVESDQQNLG